MLREIFPSNARRDLGGDLAVQACKAYPAVWADSSALLTFRTVSPYLANDNLFRPAAVERPELVQLR